MRELVVSVAGECPPIAGGYMFNSPGFQALKGGRGRYFTLQDGGHILARLGFRLVEGAAISGYEATFGSVDCLPGTTEEQKQFFLGQVIQKLGRENLQEVVIRHRPQAYGGNWHKIFTGLGFTVVQQEVNQHLLINGEAFRQQIKYNEQKKLKQAIKAGYVFRQLTLKELAGVYALVADTRNRKGYPVSMQLPDLQEAFVALPNNYHLFGLYADNELIAASVSIRVSSRVLYNFYHADAAAYRSTSPLVMLLAKIYRYCQQHHIEILDLGVSSENGLLNKGLFTFKKNLGCQQSGKNTYRLKL